MSSNFAFGESNSNPFTLLQYRDIAGAGVVGVLSEPDSLQNEGKGATADRGISDAELSEKLAEARAQATHETEERMTRVMEQKIAASRGPVIQAITAFAKERGEYYAKIEAEVVQLALSIAKKILHREAQVDTMLVATLVRMAIEKQRDGSTVKVRVHPSHVASWKAYFAGQTVGLRTEIVGDPSLSDLDCQLDTELGSTNFGLDSQLKEVEQGFFDLLALRPSNR